MNEKTQNIILGVAALGLAFALYKTFAKKSPASKPAATGIAGPDTGALTFNNGIPSFTSFAPFDSATLAGQLGIAKLLNGTVSDLQGNI